MSKVTESNCFIDLRGRGGVVVIDFMLMFVLNFLSQKSLQWEKKATGKVLWLVKLDGFLPIVWKISKKV